MVSKPRVMWLAECPKCGQQEYNSTKPPAWQSTCPFGHGDLKLIKFVEAKRGR